MYAFSPADAGDTGLFCVCDMFSFKTDLADWPGGPFHTGLVSISSSGTPPTTCWRREVDLNPEKVCFFFCRESKSSMTEVCLWGRKLCRVRPKSTKQSNCLKWTDNKGKGEDTISGLASIVPTGLL